MNTPSRARLAAVCILSIALLAACASGPKGEELSAIPVFALGYPGAVEVSRSASDSAWGIGGGHGATARRTLAVDATRDEVFRHYNEALLADGWVRARSRLPRCSSSTEAGWVKDELAIGIGWYELFDVASRPCDGVDPQVLEAHPTVYAVVMVWQEDRTVQSYEPPASQTPDPDLVALRSIDAWDLAAPGSIEIGSERAHRATQDTAADVWRRYRYDGPVEDVLAFYERELADRGWETGAGWRVRRDVRTDRAECGWNRDGVGLLLRFWDPKAWNDVFELLPYETVYDIKLIASFEGPTDVACDPASFAEESLP